MINLLLRVIKNVTDCPICKATFESLFVDVGAKRSLPGQYFLSLLDLNNFDAENACQSINGHLTEIDTPTELRAVQISLEGFVNNDEDIHIGGKVVHPDQTINSRLQEDHVLFVDWQAGQPDGKGSEECVALRRRPYKATIKMVDGSCTESVTRFLCEIPAKGPKP